MAQRIDVRAGVLHHGQHARGAGARAVRLWLVGVAVAAVQGVKVARAVRRIDGRAGEARLFEVVNPGPAKGFQPGRSHDITPCRTPPYISTRGIAACRGRRTDGYAGARTLRWSH